MAQLQSAAPSRPRRPGVLPSPSLHHPRRHRVGVTWLVAAGCVVVRLAFVLRPVGRDEAGFLAVGAQWDSGAGSLYGAYWVDRPPLLITLCWLAEQFGGLVAFRVIGAAAAGACVLVLAGTARRLWGERAAVVTALVAAVLLSSHLLASLEVNGELLAAPFTAAGVAAAVAAARAAEARGDGSAPDRSGLWAALAGICLVAALMVKQNMADAAVFGVVLAAASVWTGRVPAVRLLRPLTGAAVGTGLALLATAVWTLAHGTSPAAVFDALYPFRIEASRVIAGGGGGEESLARLVRLAGAFALSGLAALVAAGTLLAARPGGRRDPVVLALVATLAYGGFSVLGGSVYWLHYLVELVPAAALLAGRALPDPGPVRGDLPRSLAAAGVLLAVLASAGSLVRAALVEPRAPQREVAGAVRGAALGHDTLVTLYGDSDLNYLTGLPSPYEHLWTLPIKVRDPRLGGLDAVLGGPAAPTWLVSGRSLDTWGLSTGRTRALVAHRYDLVARCARYDVYLRVGLDRARPVCAASGPTEPPGGRAQEAP